MDFLRPSFISKDFLMAIDSFLLRLYSEYSCTHLSRLNPAFSSLFNDSSNSLLLLPYKILMISRSSSPRISGFYEINSVFFIFFNLGHSRKMSGIIGDSKNGYIARKKKNSLTCVS